MPAVHQSENKITVVIGINRYVIPQIQNGIEYIIHIRQFALLYAGISETESSGTAEPDQNHIGFFLCLAYKPIQINKVAQPHDENIHIITSSIRHHLLSVL